MAINRGKQWEKKFREDWKKSFPNSFLIRLPDQVSYFSGFSSNISDFIAYVYPELFLIECKTRKGNTLPFSGFTQYDALLPYAFAEGVHAGVMMWWLTHDLITWIPIESIEKMKNDGKKSVNVKMIKEKVYDIVVIPSEKKRVFFDSDYRIMRKLKKEGDKE